MDDVLLIAADWEFRRLVYAQLVEDQYEVRALPSLESALHYLVRGGEPARVTVLDLEGQDPPTTPGQVTELRQLTGAAPLILCGARLHADTLGDPALSPAAVLQRPFRVGDVVDAVAGMMKEG